MEQPDRPRPSPADVVFGTGDLLDEILIRLEFPRFLVPALQVNRFWSSRASDPAFRREFLDRLTSRPRPLGFYLDTLDPFQGSTKFVPMSQRPELAGVLGSHDNFGNFTYQSVHAVDCRNGRVLLIGIGLNEDGPYVVLDPLRQPITTTHLPPIQPPLVFCFLTGRDRPLCLFVDISWLFFDHGALVRLCFLQDGAWVDDTSHATGLSAPLGYTLDKLLDENKLYILFSDGYIVRLDLTSMRFFVIQLPDGIERMTKDKLYINTQLLSRAVGSGVYLIKVSGTKLSVWLCKTHGDNPVIWVQEDTFCLYGAFGDFASWIWTERDKINSYDVVIRLFGAGDNAEFVFLIDMDGCTYDHIFYLNIRTRKVEKAYVRDSTDGAVLGICPFMMV